VLKDRTSCHHLFGSLKPHGALAESTITRKCKWLFVNVHGYKRTSSTATEFLNSYRDLDKCIGVLRDYVRWFTEVNGKTGYV
jgi:hypothetical protein